MLPPAPAVRPPSFLSMNGRVIAGLAWLILFCLIFFQFDLPNSGPPRINRGLIVENLPWLLLDGLFPEPPLRPDSTDPRAGPQYERQVFEYQHSGWAYFPQRLPLIGIAALILAGAWGWGGCLLHGLRLTARLDALERLVLATGLGLAALSLLTLLCGLAGFLSRPAFAAILIAGVIGERALAWRQLRKMPPQPQALPGEALISLSPWLLVTLPFLGCLLLGALLPEVDFDVKEYHFQGPKEWYVAGRITFLEHNVYTSFPFLTEMLTLSGMVLYGDWYWGALAGKAVLASFAPLTALGLLAAGRRWFSPAAGTWAAIIYLSVPWVYRISIIAYAEGGLTFYLFTSFWAAALARDGFEHTSPPRDGDRTRDRNLSLVAGLLAGSAMACKYPGLLSVVIPVGLLIILPQQGKLRFQAAAWFILGVAVAIGPWLAKNAVQTSNPVYPLAYSVFGGRDWSPERDAQWKRAHSPDHHHPSDLLEKLIDVTLKSDWLSPLLYGFAPLAGFVAVRRRRLLELGIYALFLFATWWAFTHRIDRFWVPMIPIVALLAGAGAAWTTQRRWQIPAATVTAFVLLFNLAFIMTQLCGYNRYLLDLNLAAEDTARITSPELVQIAAVLPPGSKVLCIGDAEVFDARFPLVYNTVFDDSLFERWCGVDQPGIPAADKPLRPDAEIRATLAAQGITHLYVNWLEILRYRTTYRYTDFVSPQRFIELERRGLLAERGNFAAELPFRALDANQQKEVEQWGPELKRGTGDQTRITTFQLYEVVPTPGDD